MNANITHVQVKFPSQVLRHLLTFFFLLPVGWIASTPAHAQQDVGYVGGTLTDASGDVVAGAKVNLRNDSTGIARDLVSDGNGYYQSQPLPPGRYSLTVSLEGFSTASVRNIVVDAAAHVTSNVKLVLGSVTTRVDVQATPPALDIVDAQIGNTVDTRAVQELPVNGRSVLALATLSPGVESAAGATNQGFTNRGTQASAIRISGGVPGGNNNLLDGVSNLQNYLGEVAINIKADSVQEFRIMTGVIPAQFGYTSGGVINVITRSGGNQFHGSLYEFFRNDALDAATAIPKPALGKPELRFNNYGGTFGGPIKRDRAFFFGNYEEYRFVNGAPYLSSVPTAQERNGDFSDLGHYVTTGGTQVCQPTIIYDPTTGSSTTPRTAYPGNKISNMDPVAVAAQSLFYPLSNQAGDSCTHSNNYYADPKLVSREKTALGRIDFRVSEKDSLLARYAYYQNFTNNGNLGYGPLYYRNDTLQNYDAMISETHIFSPSLINDLRFAILRSDFPFQAVTANQNYASKIGLPGVGPIVAPIFNNGLTALNGTIGFRASTTIELVDDVTRTIGSHTLHVGFDGRFVEGYNNQSGNASGAYSFSANQTAQGTDATIVTGTGSQYASFLAGAVGSASVGLAQGIAFRQQQYAGYVQDDWHPNQRLTLNFGLRYDYQRQPYEKHNGIDDFDITRVNTLNGYLGAVRYAGLNGEGGNFVKENWNDWGPRVGFALVLTNDNRTVARGGFAIYYPTTAQVSYDQAAGNFNGFGSLNTNYGSATTNGTAFKLANGVPFPATQPLGAAGGQNAFLGQAGYYILPDAKDPQSQQYTLTLSRELPYQMVLDVSYLGNHGTHFNLGNQNIDVLDPSNFSEGAAYLNASVPNPYAGKVPGTLGAATITRANLLKPYPYMQSVVLSNPRSAHFDGNFLYVSVQRRAQRGLQVLGSYTYGKVMDLPISTDISTTTGISSTGGTIQNIHNFDGDYSVDAIDVTHRGVVSALYDLPFGKNQRFLNKSAWLDHLVGGIQFNTVITAETGRPLAFSGANNSGIATRPNFRPGMSVRVAHPTRAKWFNDQAFINPAPYTFGNTPRYYSQVRGPGVLNFDMSVFKTTHITERTSLELRLEAFNAFNKTNLGQPSTGFTAGSDGLNTNSNMGVILSSLPARQIQLAAKLHF
ncbi:MULTISPECIES: TonB-dependent receptor [Acidobacteriaceae]|uniref:TonB-dependent receptor n=1 Tax=Acidobacteriaceae TaxID=204434 RepID=UPI00131B127E|nr:MULTISPECIES: carboxypeptidase regulatory-like domain-containing protein [Acidobacteriaceae]MDW5266241.1 carboxypeptidase regulatory-like domain-containing protein [Edaphobacter sp.]